MKTVTVFACIFIPFIASDLEPCPNSPREVNVNDIEFYDGENEDLTVVKAGEKHFFHGTWNFTAPENVDIPTDLVHFQVRYFNGEFGPVCSLQRRVLMTKDGKYITDKYLPKGQYMTAKIYFITSRCTLNKFRREGDNVTATYQILFDTFDSDGLCAYTRLDVRF